VQQSSYFTPQAGSNAQKGHKVGAKRFSFGLTSPPTGGDKHEVKPAIFDDLNESPDFVPRSAKNGTQTVPAQFNKEPAATTRESCPGCQRTFNKDRLQKHLRLCKGARASQKSPMTRSKPNEEHYMRANIKQELQHVKIEDPS